jgi:hypothetical protein
LGSRPSVDTAQTGRYAPGFTLPNRFHAPSGRRIPESAAYQNCRISRSLKRADARTRTGDPFITSEVPYKLSYVGTDRKLPANGDVPHRPPRPTRQRTSRIQRTPTHAAIIDNRLLLACAGAVVPGSTACSGERRPRTSWRTSTHNGRGLSRVVAPELYAAAAEVGFTQQGCASGAERDPYLLLPVAGGLLEHLGKLLIDLVGMGFHVYSTHVP